MKGLYRKVTSGKFNPISESSADLNLVIKMMLQIKPGLRPSCEKLLEMPVLTRNIEAKEDYEEIENTQGVIETIRLPPSLRQLRTKLPGPNYDNRKRNLSAKGRKEDTENIIKIGSDKNFKGVLTPSPTLRASLKSKPQDRNIFKERALQEINQNISRLPPMHRALSLNNR